jgi:hypothetical protein
MGVLRLGTRQIQEQYREVSKAAAILGANLAGVNAREKPPAASGVSAALPARNHELPIKMPTANTAPPPTITCSADESKGVSI